jgi:hypothetical protein
MKFSTFPRPDSFPTKTGPESEVDLTCQSRDSTRVQSALPRSMADEEPSFFDKERERLVAEITSVSTLRLLVLLHLILEYLEFRNVDI